MNICIFIHHRHCIHVIVATYYLRRAKAERESQKKALKERAKKGLLSEEEKLRLATAEAEGNQQDDKKECVVM